MSMTLLLPALGHFAPSEVVARWWRIGDRGKDSLPKRESILRECFRTSDTSVPTAALTRRLDADDAETAQWLRADPAFVMADAVTLRLLAHGKMDLSASEVDGFAQALKPLFDGSGFSFEATLPDRWYLRGPLDAKLPKFSSPEDALGDDLAQHLPEGDNARYWRGLLNEVQMTLHDHPLNVARVRRGLPPVNSLWMWGGGVLPKHVSSQFDAVYSDDEVVVALAQLANVSNIGSAHEALSLDISTDQREGWVRGHAAGSPLAKDSSSRQSYPPMIKSSGERRQQAASILIDLGYERDLVRLEKDCFAPIDAALARSRISALHLLFASGERVVVKPLHHWRFWRRSKNPNP
jgi:hypothetical protein